MQARESLGVLAHQRSRRRCSRHHDEICRQQALELGLDQRAIDAQRAGEPVERVPPPLKPPYQRDVGVVRAADDNILTAGADQAQCAVAIDEGLYRWPQSIARTARGAGERPTLSRYRPLKKPDSARTGRSGISIFRAVHLLGDVRAHRGARCTEPWRAGARRAAPRSAPMSVCHRPRSTRDRHG
jgi:hypothetical protein